MKKNKKTVNEIKGYRVYSQYILAGAAIGLYYGIFYRGAQSPPDYGMAVILSVLGRRFNDSRPKLEEKEDLQSGCPGFHQSHRDVHGLLVSFAIEFLDGSNRRTDTGNHIYDYRWNPIWDNDGRAPKTNPAAF